MHVHWRAAAAMHGRIARSDLAPSEVHFVFPMRLLRPRGANNGAAGDSGLVRTQSGSGPPTFGVVRTHEQFWEVR